MSDGNGTERTGSAQAWAQLADQFNAIARQFRQHYERVTASPHPEPELTQGSVQRAVSTVGKAIEDTARAIDESVHDPKVRQDTGQAGSALLRAVGATLTDLGAALQREPEPPAKPAPAADVPAVSSQADRQADRQADEPDSTTTPRPDAD